MNLLRRELEEAITACDIVRVMACIHANVEVNYYIPKHRSPLIMAIKQCGRIAPEIVPALIEAGAYAGFEENWYEGKSVWEDAPLAVAALYGNVPAFRACLKAGADPLIQPAGVESLLAWLSKSMDPDHQAMVEAVRELCPEAFLDGWTSEVSR